MSSHFNTINLLHAIREIPKEILKPLEKHILTVLLSCMNGDNQTWYSLQSIATFSCMSLRGLHPHIRSLARKKFIFVEAPDTHGRTLTNNYSLNINQIMAFHLTKSDEQHDVKGEEYAPFKEKKGARRAEKGARNVMKRVHGVPTKIETEEEKRRGGHQTAPMGASGDPFPVEPKDPDHISEGRGMPEAMRRMMAKMFPWDKSWQDNGTTH